MAKSTQRATGRKKTQASKTSATKPKSSPTAASTAPDDFDDFDELEALNALEAEAAELEAEAEAAAAAASAAKAAYLARQAAAQEVRKPTQQASAQSSAGVNESNGNYLDMLTRAFDNLNSNDLDPNALTEMTNGVGMVLGSGPAFAALGSMLANSTAQGSVLMNATQMQRQLDQVGLCCTSACVKQLLSMNDGYDSE